MKTAVKELLVLYTILYIFSCVLETQCQVDFKQGEYQRTSITSVPCSVQCSGGVAGAIKPENVMKRSIEIKKLLKLIVSTPY